MKESTLSALPDWPALMDLDTTILYLGGSRASLDKLESGGYLQRWQNGHKAVRFTRKEVDTALIACALHEREVAERRQKKKGAGQ